MKKIYYLILLCLTISSVCMGQAATVASQNFDGNNDSNWDTNFVEDNTNSSTSWGTYNSLGPISNADPNDLFLGFNNSAPLSSKSRKTIEFSNINVQYFSSLEISFDFQYSLATANDTSAEITIVTVDENGNLDYITDTFLVGANTTSGVVSAPQNFNIDLLTSGGSASTDDIQEIYMEITLISTSASNYLAIDNVELIGEVKSEFDGLIYDEINYGGWKNGNEPDNSTTAENVLIINGSYTFTGRTNVNNLTISSEANVRINYNGRVRVYGNLLVDNNLTITSKSDSYGTLRVDGTATGLATYERFTMMDGINDLVSAPLSGITFGEFASSTGINNDSLYYSQNDNNLKKFGPFVKTAGVGGSYANWHAINDSNEILESGVGYRASTVSGNLLSYTGNVVTENVETDVYFNISTLASQWNLVGNPYPSFITMTPFLNVNQDLFQEDKVAVYAYNGTDWTIYNNNNAVNIAPGQGFYVAVNENIANLGKLEFRSSWMRLNNEDDFIAGRTETNYFLDIALNADDKEKHSNQLYFNENGTNNLDKGYDSSIYGLNESGYTLFTQLVEGNTNYRLAIQTLNQDEVSEGEVSVQLGVIAPEGKKISISIKETNLDSTTKVYLEDTITDEWILLNDSPYTFVTNESLNGVGRFVLHISNEKSLGIEDNIQENQLQIYSGEHSIKLKGQLNKNTHLSVFDVQGRQIHYSTINQTVSEYTIDTVNLSSGIYIIRIDNNGNKISKRVILK
ncbi:T9SS type A sorting domain-containing protein [Formosa sediminum]|uniref:T9SS type A sorting domain-containing protein n=1 Tax=Formosa sediminum TaxID=2594004 RepID=A0A516GQ77_9FLAO|nr:T9SS type A sorting domain-containing protein [Formosa sediminum]QDO93666.1 T9SS type A sorting domain-containing protein [Formosa sediminum]